MEAGSFSKHMGRACTAGIAGLAGPAYIQHLYEVEIAGGQELQPGKEASNINCPSVHSILGM